MGAWGVKAWDNDTAADWFGDTLEPVAEEVEKLLRLPVDRSHYDKYRAAAWLLIKIGQNFVYNIDFLEEHLSELLARLQTIRADKEWINTWRNEDNIIKEIDKQIALIQKV